MKVSKIFIILITIVACVLIGALVLNILLPNVATSLVDMTETQIYNATKLSFDFNGNGIDGKAGASGSKANMNNDNTGTDVNQNQTVNGF